MDSWIVFNFFAISNNAATNNLMLKSFVMQFVKQLLSICFMQFTGLSNGMGKQRQMWHGFRIQRAHDLLRETDDDK